MKIPNARYGFQFEQAEQFTDTLVGVECDLLPALPIRKRKLSRRKVKRPSVAWVWCRKSAIGLR